MSKKRSAALQRGRGVSGKFQATAREPQAMFEDEELVLDMDDFMEDFGTLHSATGSPYSFTSFSPIVSPQDRDKTCGDPTQFPIDTRITATSPVDLEVEFSSKPAQSSDADSDEQGAYALVRTQTMCYSAEDADAIERCTAQGNGPASTSQSSSARQPPGADAISSSPSSSEEESSEEEEEEEAISMNVKVATSKNGLGEEGAATVVVVLEPDIALGSSNCDRLPDGKNTFLSSIKNGAIACLPRLIAEGLDISSSVFNCPGLDAYAYSVIDESSPRAKKKKFVMKPLDTERNFRSAFARNDDDFGVVFIYGGPLELVHRDGGVPRTAGAPTISEGGPLSSRVVVVCSFAHRSLRGTKTDFKITKETSQVDSSADGDWCCLDELLVLVNKQLYETKRHLVSGEVLAYKGCNKDGSVVRGTEYSLTSDISKLHYVPVDSHTQITRIAVFVCKHGKDPKWLPKVPDEQANMDGHGENTTGGFNVIGNDDETMERLRSIVTKHMADGGYVPDDQTVKLAAHKIFTQKTNLAKTLQKGAVHQWPSLPPQRELRRITCAAVETDTTRLPGGGGGAAINMSEVKELLMMQVMQGMAQTFTPGKTTERFTVTPEPTQFARLQQNEQDGTVLNSHAKFNAEMAEIRSARKEMQNTQALLTKSIHDLTTLVSSVINEQRTQNT